MQESRIIRHLLILCGFFVFAVIFGSLGTEARAEDTVHIIREAAGDLEQLEAIEISDEEISEWEIAESIQDASNRASAAANQFLNYSSNYGYQDMAKRSNGAGRQYAYRQLETISKNFTVNGQDADQETYSGNTYDIAGVVDLSNYNLTGAEKTEVYFTFRHDNPQYFWLSNRVLYGSNNLVVLTYDEYRDGTVRQDTLEEIVQTAQEVYESAIDVSDSNYQKILKIHDALIADIEYSRDTSVPIAHSIAGAMTSRKSAVCEGYAKVMQVMMNQYGIMNIYVTGTANGGGHAWNMVKMSDGEYYWLDATWDDQRYEEYQHQYFLVGDANFTDHEADLSTGSGTDFLYELPQASEEDYVHDPADDVGNNIVSGKCGENVEYELNLSTGVMQIYGSGAMDDYGWTDNYGMIRAPWIREEYDSDIISIKVEEGVTHIGNYAFYRGYIKKYCENVQSVEIAGTVETIGEAAFLGCDKLILTKGTEGIKNIGKEAFSATSLTDFPWSDSLERIEDGAFSSANFVEILMPSKVQLIGARAFSNCKYLKVLSTSDNCEIKSNAFELCNALENVTIGSGCQIRGGTFRECSLLKNITIGEGSICISDAKNDYTVGRIFENCTSLQTILLPDSWRFYGDNENGEETGAYIVQFEGCTQLKDIRFQDTNNRYKVIDNVVFSKDGSTLIYYPLALQEIEYEIPDHVTKIGAFAFYDNENIENVFIPSSVKEIKTRAFDSCTKLKNVIIPEGMEELGIGIFSYCKNLNAVVIPPSVNKIDKNYKSSTATFGNAGLNVIYGEKDSYAQEFAGQTGYKFENTIYCSFDENGGNINEKKKPVIYNDKYHKLPTPTRTGYKFLGWYTEKEAGEKIESDTIVSAEASHILYAHWEKEYLKGDVNDDGTVNILDLRIVLRNICGKVELTKQQIIIADVVVDGVIDIQDLRLELRFVCGKIQEL